MSATYLSMLLLNYMHLLCFLVLTVLLHWKPMNSEFSIQWIIYLFNYYLCEVAFEQKFSLTDNYFKMNQTSILILFIGEIKLQKLEKRKGSQNKFNVKLINVLNEESVIHHQSIDYFCLAYSSRQVLICLIISHLIIIYKLKLENELSCFFNVFWISQLCFSSALN